MSEQNRPLRKIAVPDHVWDSFDQMARDSGAERDSLVAQALFMFARLNGYLPSGAQGVLLKAGQSAPARAEAPAARPKAAEGAVAKPPEPPPPENVARREVADRVLETAAELERMMKEKARLEASSGEGRSEAPPRELFLVGDEGALDKVMKDRFVIGRGKHCDLVINSGKVSREHAAILREGGEHFIEDLGSSNGTWFDKQRIRRRKIEDGDEYFICNERVKCVIR
jgi:FHA domain